MQYSVNNALKIHQNTFFVFLKMKIFNRAERYTLFTLCDSVYMCVCMCVCVCNIYIYIHIHTYKHIYIADSRLSKLITGILGTGNRALDTGNQIMRIIQN